MGGAAAEEGVARQPTAGIASLVAVVGKRRAAISWGLEPAQIAGARGRVCASSRGNALIVAQEEAGGESEAASRQPLASAIPMIQLGGAAFV